MPSKSLVMLGLFLGSTLGGYVPTLFGASFLSFWSLIGSTAGGIIGIWLGYKYSTDY